MRHPDGLAVVLRVKQRGPGLFGGKCPDHVLQPYALLAVGVAHSSSCPRGEIAPRADGRQLAGDGVAAVGEDPESAGLVAA